MKSVALHNLGCKVNAYEIEYMQQKLQESGYTIVPFDSKADIYIINTCTVTNVADRKSRQMLHRAKRLNPDAVVVAAGCYVQTDAGKAVLDPCIDLAVGNNRKKELVHILGDFLKEREENGKAADVIDISKTDEYEEMRLERTAEHTRAHIKIQDGCSQFCSYCIIPYVRGRVRSRRREDVLAEVKGLAERGCREVVLTGIHLSSYGMDFIGQGDGDYLEEGKDLRAAAFQRAYLISLIEEISKTEGIERIRLGSLEPRIITEDFVRRLSAVREICPHFHLSLQSGCDETLKRMNRHYTTGEYYEKVQLLRSAFTHPAVTTDVITGFPGETEEEFACTEEFLKKVSFYEMHIFKYSRRRGTAADRLSGQLTEGVKQERSARLLSLKKCQSRKFREFYIGKEVEILVEEKKEIDGVLCWTGHTPDYVRGAVPVESSDGCLENRLVRGIAAGFAGEETLLLGHCETVNPAGA